jgi:hypothetical protein
MISNRMRQLRNMRDVRVLAALTGEELARIDVHGCWSVEELQKIAAKACGAEHGVDCLVGGVPVDGHFRKALQADPVMQVVFKAAPPPVWRELRCAAASGNSCVMKWYVTDIPTEEGVRDYVESRWPRRYARLKIHVDGLELSETPDVKEALELCAAGGREIEVTELNYDDPTGATELERFLIDAVYPLAQVPWAFARVTRHWPATLERFVAEFETHVVNTFGLRAEWRARAALLVAVQSFRGGITDPQELKAVIRATCSTRPRCREMIERAGRARPDVYTPLLRRFNL